MKKTILFICLLALSLQLSAKTQNFDVYEKAQLTSALEQIASMNAKDIAYVYIHGDIDAKTLKSGDGNVMASTLRNIHFIGVNDTEGNRATLRMEMQLPKGTQNGSGFSLHFDNLRLCQTQGVWGNSKHLINFRDQDLHWIDTIEFINCELTDLCRSLYRAEIQDKENSQGTLRFFRMENCQVHNGSRQTNAMPLIYLGQPVGEMQFVNNTFYDLTYLNSIVTFGQMPKKQATVFRFTNNTVCSWSQKALFDMTYADVQNEYHIKNNIFLFPYWADDKNNRFGDTKDEHDNMTDSDSGMSNGILTPAEINARLAQGVDLTVIAGGLVQLENNILNGYRYQDMNDNIIPIGDTENEQPPFTSMSMKDAGLEWSDFYNVEDDKFLILKSHAIYTAGKNNEPVGDRNNFVDFFPKAVNLNISVSGGTDVTFSVTPEQETYYAGDKITITLFDHNNALRQLNTFKGWKEDQSKQTVRTIQLTGDLTLTAEYETALDNILSFFDFAKEPAEGRDKISSYKADLFAPGHQAVATVEFFNGSEYETASGSEKVFYWRNNKFDEDPVDQRVCALARRTSEEWVNAQKPTILVFQFSTKGLSSIRFSAFCGTDLYGYLTQLAQYSLDQGNTWNNLTQTDLVSRPCVIVGQQTEDGLIWGWTEIQGMLPKEAENQEDVRIRIIGDTEGATVNNGTSTVDESNMFEYVAAVFIEHSVPSEGLTERSSRIEEQGQLIFQNGHLFILRANQLYTLTGQQMQ